MLSQTVGIYKVYNAELLEDFLAMYMKRGRIIQKFTIKFFIVFFTTGKLFFIGHGFVLILYC